MFCSKCGKPIDPDIRFCMECGAENPEFTKNKPSNQPEANVSDTPAEPAKESADTEQKNFASAEIKSSDQQTAQWQTPLLRSRPKRATRSCLLFSAQ